MKQFCDECGEDVSGEKLEYCKSLNHPIDEVLGDKEHRELKEEEKKIKSGKLCITSKGKKKFQHEILEEPFVNLRPITLIENKTRMILVYLPTKSKRLIENEEPEEIEFSYKAFFITAKEGIVSPKSIIPLDSEEIKKNFKTTVLPTFIEGRWDSKQVFKWLESDDKKLEWYLQLEPELVIDSTKRNELEIKKLESEKSELEKAKLECKRLAEEHSNLKNDLENSIPSHIENLIEIKKNEIISELGGSIMTKAMEQSRINKNPDYLELLHHIVKQLVSLSNNRDNE